jgi:hypothetical protein
MLSFLVIASCAAAGCRAPLTHNLPPAQRLLEPGPGVGGPGPGVMMMGAGPAPALAAAGMFQPPTSQVAFIGPAGMTITWDVSGHGLFDSEPLVVPGRQNFPQGAIYRLKLSNIPGRPGEELYPTLEIGPATPRTDAFLAHTPIPIQFNEEDWEQVLGGNYVTKVIYLPDPEFQELALADVATLVSTRLDPGVDPIVEADRRGAILAIIRLGNKDLEMPGAEAAYDRAVVPASHSELGGSAAAGHGVHEMHGHAVGGGPMGVPTGAFGPAALPPHLVSGVNSPQWGMPISGTPIGLPGPPHIPLGGPAGLQKHVMKNHTVRHIPHPVEKFRIDVKQRPGMSYPKPPHHMRITEQVRSPGPIFRNPFSNMHEVVTQQPPGPAAHHPHYGGH